MSKSVLLTGGAGFIGSNLHRRCLEEGWSVFSVDDFSNGHQEFVPKSAFCLRSDFADVRVLDMVRRQQFDTVMHIAAVPRVGYSVEHPLETNHINVSKTLELMEACKGNINRFVFASSSSVYGGAERLPTAEDSPKDPKSPYALQKAVIEDYLRLYWELYGMDSACLRFFNVFGRNALGGSAYATAVAAWLTAIKMNKPLRYDGDGTQSRDLCYVDNVTDCLVRAAKAPGKLQAMPINVACGDRTTNREIFEYLCDRYPNTLKIDSPWRPGDVMHTQADIGRAKEVLGYEPLVRVFKGLEQTCDWYDINWELISRLKLRT